MNTFCKIDKKLLFNEDNYYAECLSGEALAVMISIGINCYGKDTKKYLTYYNLEFFIYRDTKHNRANMYNIVKGFNELVDKNIIIITEKVSKNEFICDISKIISNRSRIYITITYNEFYKIMDIKDNVKNFNLLRYYLILLATFEANKIDKYSYKIGTKTQEYLACYAKTTITTINKYNQILEKNQLIYIIRRKRPANNKANSGKIYNQLPNVYSKYIDMDICNQYVNDSCFVKMNKSFVDISNEMRSLSQIYNYFKRTYTDIICEDISKVKKAYSAAKKWNEYVEEDYKAKIENGDHPEEPKYKDLSIFEQYGLTD